MAVLCLVAVITSSLAVAGTALAHEGKRGAAEFPGDPAAKADIHLSPAPPSTYAGAPCERTDLIDGSVIAEHEDHDDHTPSRSWTRVEWSVRDLDGSCPGPEQAGSSFFVFGFRFEPANHDRATVETWVDDDLDVVSSRVTWYDSGEQHVSEEFNDASVDLGGSPVNHAEDLVTGTVPNDVATPPYRNATFFAASSPCAPGADCPVQRPGSLVVARHADTVPTVGDADFWTGDT